MQTKPNAQTQKTNFWLISQRWDEILITKGSVVGIIFLTILFIFRGDKELDILDLVLSEFHLGATYDSIFRRKLYKTMHWEILYIPIFIILTTYYLFDIRQDIIITTFLAYASIWHRGRQNYGVALYYQKSLGLSQTRLHKWLFRGAIYMPMICAVLFYTSYHPIFYEGYEYYSLPTPISFSHIFGLLSLVIIFSYFLYFFKHKSKLHIGEFWVVLSHVLAFMSAYIFGAWSAGFIIILAIHHEFQYLYFTYAVARKKTSKLIINSWGEIKFFLLFLLLPIVGFMLAMTQERAQIEWLFPLWTAVLICHYWLDGCIWTRKAWQKSQN